MAENWVTNAAKELALHFSFGSHRDSYVTDEQRNAVAQQYAKIIRKHLPRCDSCKYWGKSENANGRECERVYKLDAKGMWPDMYDSIYTSADFGCVQYEAKP